MSDPTDPTQPQPGPPPEPGPDPAAEPRPPRPPLRRSADDRVIGGVCGGVARTLGIDALIVRIVTVVLVLAGGAGALLYLGGLLLMPDDASASAPGDDRARGRLATVTGVVVLTIAGLIVINGLTFGLIGPLIPLAFLALFGLGAWWVVSGEGASGGAKDIARRSLLGVLVLAGCAVLAALSFYAGTTDAGWIVAAVVIAAGVALLAGAVVRPVRFLILPALALALPLAAAEASDLDLTGGLGERTYRPTTANAVRADYELGAGRLVVDLRGARLPDGDTNVHLRLGAGEAVLLVDPGTCVGGTAEVRAGVVQAFGHEETGGLSVDWEQLPQRRPGNPRVVVDADIGFGALTIDHVDPDQVWNRDRRRVVTGPDDAPVQAACQGRRAP